MSSKKMMWRCRINPNHTWLAAISNRTSRSSGCPQCSIAPESRQAVLLKFEVLRFLPFDPHESKVRIDQGLLDVDVLVPSHQLVVEFDGSYWHKGHEVHDAWKAAALKSRGWKVVRVREEPLTALGPCDLVVPAGLSLKQLASRVLSHLETVLEEKLPGLPEYLETDELCNAAAAEQYIDGMLRAKLDGEGPRWRARRIGDWKDGYRRLLEYRDEYGSTSPPAGYQCADGFPLGEWAKQQRVRRPDLSQARRDLLDAEGFIWSPRVNAWNQAYVRLEQYIRHRGTNPPLSYVSPDGFRLGAWLNGQRQSWETMSEEHRQMLVNVGVEQAPRTAWRESTWESGIDHLKRYARTYGNASPAQLYIDPNDGFRLGSWVCGVRSRTNLSSSQLAELAALGFVSNTLEQGWDDSLKALAQYYAAHAPKLPAARSELRRWLERQRRAYRSGDMREDRVKAFTLSRLLGLLVPQSWEEGIVRLTAYAQASSDDVPVAFVCADDGFPLGEWLASQLRRASRRGLQADQVEMLVSLGFLHISARPAHSTEWDEAVDRIAAYIAAHGRTPPKRYVEPDGFPLGTRVQYIRVRARDGRLPEDLASRLADTGFDFAPPIGRPSGVKECRPRAGRRE